MLFKIAEKSPKIAKTEKLKKNCVRTFRRNSASSSQVHFIGNENYWLLGMFPNFSNDLIGQFKGPNVHNWVNNNNGIHITTGLGILEEKSRLFFMVHIFSKVQVIDFWNSRSWAIADATADENIYMLCYFWYRFSNIYKYWLNGFKTHWLNIVNN